MVAANTDVSVGAEEGMDLVAEQRDVSVAGCPGKVAAGVLDKSAADKLYREYDKVSVGVPGTLAASAAGVPQDTPGLSCELELSLHHQQRQGRTRCRQTLCGRREDHLLKQRNGLRSDHHRGRW